MSRATSTILFAVLALLMCGVPAFADPAHLLTGTWKVDVSKLTIPNTPRSVTLALAHVGGDRYKMTVDITFDPDGTPSPAVGNADYDKVSMTMPSARILVMGGAFEGHPANTRVFSLLDDGMHMIETVVWHTPDGTPHTRVDSWTRAK
ncbi:MAG TPA: hypothetical protein VMU40_13485 [Steroidobacteraceae bacterium]|nr:hypothetical protein [Steroidobacteraceae bacterium]